MYVQLAMINIHCKLMELSEQSVARHRSNSSAAAAADDLPLFLFRQPRSLPGGGLYRQLDDCRAVLQIHDELLFEVRERDLARVAAIVKDCMEGAVSLRVPLQVKLSSGAAWGSLSPYQLPGGDSAAA